MTQKQRVLQFGTPVYNTYRRNYMLEDGSIEYTFGNEVYINDVPHKGSDTWYITGAIRFNNFGYTVERYTVQDLVALPQSEFQYKNGKQRIFLTDFDHGTHRILMGDKVTKLINR